MVRGLTALLYPDGLGMVSGNIVPSRGAQVICELDHKPNSDRGVVMNVGEVKLAQSASVCHFPAKRTGKITMTEDVAGILAELEIEIVPTAVSPGANQTCAGATLASILFEKGAGHLRLVLRTIVNLQQETGARLGSLLHWCSFWYHSR